VERWCATTPDNFTFDVKLHQLFRSSTQRIVAAGIAANCPGRRKGKVNTSPELRDALLESFLRPMSILQSAESSAHFVGSFAGVLAAKTSPNELEPLVEKLVDINSQSSSEIATGRRRSAKSTSFFCANATWICERRRARRRSFSVVPRT